jgi:hypothetical protein
MLFHSCEFLLLSLQEIVTRPAADASRQIATVGVQTLANVILYIGWRGLELRSNLASGSKTKLKLPFQLGN